MILDPVESTFSIKYNIQDVLTAFCSFVCLLFYFPKQVISAELDDVTRVRVFFFPALDQGNNTCD